MRTNQGRRPPLSPGHIADSLSRIAALIGRLLLAGMTARAQVLLASPPAREKR
ncbi:hypothetical protein BV98_003042 [Sphingobium herbicidovorans NBRC 16415]|jgi:hypothetical protein|uniref:Uncharacterized protein n=1 Tax=Sphingobium herbicidovorans (strain ATCC 700291 / DSM 11019 / CCUG 56400 / KCTC 2939 / LMG 18315 / NBRC 16415 / MH) TaxID=1219045 RepID=A0A086P747_SPHHM|nr:hypothetical protein BV98_003042 [Sphingobium herbicidovorans NBRC 16415]